MAKIQEEIIVVKLSKLVKSDGNPPLTSGEFVQEVEAVIQGLIGEDTSIVVEVEKA
jgi:hypothetical protein